MSIINTKNGRRAINKDGIPQVRIGVWAPRQLINNMKRFVKKNNITFKDGVITSIEYFLKNFAKSNEPEKRPATRADDFDTEE